MGFWLWRYFQSQRNFATDAQTEVFNLPKKGIISNLMIETYLRSGSTNLDVYSQDAITKIEVIGNGSTVIQSLTGAQVQASMAYDDNHLSPDKEMSPSGGCYGYFEIRFGRHVGDQLYALDCSKWDSLELKITYAVAAGADIGETGFTSGSGKLTVYGLYSPDGAGLSPVGYIKKAQKKVYVTSSGGTEDLELPNDYPFRRIMMLITTHNQLPYLAWYYVTVNINNGARKPIDNMAGNDLVQLDLALRGNPTWKHVKAYYLAQQTSDIHPRIGWIKMGSLFNNGGATTGVLLGLCQVQVYCDAIGSGWVEVEGVMPERSLCIDLERWSGGKHGVEAMMDTWGFDQTADIHLQHEQYTASIDSQVVLEQYVPQLG